MGKSYLPHSVSTTWKSTPPTKTVRASRTPTKGQEPRVAQTSQNSGFVRSLVKRVGTVAYISNGVEHAFAVQYGITESYEDTINHFPDKTSGRGEWERRGALAGFYGIPKGCWVEWSWSEEAETLPFSFIPNQTRALPPKLGDCALLDGDL